MKRHLIEVWGGIQYSLIHDAINQWRKRLHLCVRCKVGYYEHSHCLLDPPDFPNLLH